MPSFWITRKNGDRFEVLFDEGDRDLVEAHTWHVANGRGTSYAKRTVTLGGRRNIFLHQGVAARKNPAVSPLGWDHKNGNGLDNRRENLRPATPSQQEWAKRKRKGCSSKFKGVSWDRHASKWEANIYDGAWHTNTSGRTMRRQRHLGYFDSEVEAADAYEKAARAAHGEFISIALVAAK